MEFMTSGVFASYAGSNSGDASQSPNMRVIPSLASVGSTDIGPCDVSWVVPWRFVQWGLCVLRSLQHLGGLPCQYMHYRSSLAQRSITTSAY